MKKRYFLLILIFFIKLESCTQNADNQKITHRESKTNPPTTPKPEWQEGDIIFQNSYSSQSRAIQLATHSNYTHVGIVFKNQQKWYVLEAVQPVKSTPLNVWIKNGQKEHFVVKRLKNADKLLTIHALEKMKSVGQSYLGKNYDLYFGWSDERIYCSELVWKIYYQALGIEIGKLEKLGSFDLNHPEVKQKLKERYGLQIPVNEQVISPQAIFVSDKLEKVDIVP
jgi:uncharacterized protein YycO